MQKVPRRDTAIAAHVHVLALCVAGLLIISQM
jgi:hypothetical protein